MGSDHKGKAILSNLSFADEFTHFLLVVLGNQVRSLICVSSPIGYSDDIRILSKQFVGISMKIMERRLSQ